MKVKVFIVDGIVDSVRADDEALKANVEVEIIDYDKNTGDFELLDREFELPGFSPCLHEVNHCEPIILTSGDELEDYILEEYDKYDTELNSLLFDVQVEMPEYEILEAYKSIQHLINGDFVGRYHVIRQNGELLIGDEYDEFIPEGMYQSLYTGKAKDFLEKFNGREDSTGFCRFDGEERLDFIF